MTMTANSIGAIILAAGGSSRLGRAKQLLRFEGRTLLSRAVQAALEAGCAPVVVVLGARAAEVEAEVAGEIAGEQVLVARNERWSEGLSTSVCMGIEALEALEALGASPARAALLLPCDQPLLSAALLRQMMQRQSEGAAIVVCEYAGAWGAPMLFERGLWPQLQVLEGDRGAQKVARDNADLVSAIPFEGGALDIDTDQDFQDLLARSP